MSRSAKHQIHGSLAQPLETYPEILSAARQTHFLGSHFRGVVANDLSALAALFRAVEYHIARPAPLRQRSQTQLQNAWANQARDRVTAQHLLHRIQQRVIDAFAEG